MRWTEQTGNLRVQCVQISAKHGWLVSLIHQLIVPYEPTQDMARLSHKQLQSITLFRSGMYVEKQLVLLFPVL